MERVTDARAPLLEVRDLTLSFGGLTALSEVGFDVRTGELFAIIGPNGAGKTSIFNCLSGVYRPERGTITFAGERIDGRSPVAIARRGMARTFQNLALFGNLTVLENVLLGRHHLMRTGWLAGALWVGRARREELAHRARCEEILELLELEPYRFHRVALLPYGVRKRLELARALAMEPKLLLLDEQNASMALSISTRGSVLETGKVVREAPASELLADQDIQEFYLGVGEAGRRSFKDVKSYRRRKRWSA